MNLIFKTDNSNQIDSNALYFDVYFYDHLTSSNVNKGNYINN